MHLQPTRLRSLICSEKRLNFCDGGDILRSSFLSIRMLLLLFFAVVVLAVPTKPVWPEQFDTAFGLNDHLYIPPFHNVSSHMYYDWANSKAQLLDYPVRCFPLESIVSGHKPCKLLFNPKGIFYHSDDVDCCTFVEGVGAVPPECKFCSAAS